MLIFKIFFNALLEPFELLGFETKHQHLKITSFRHWVI